jgi:hypothetical protein
MKSVDYNPKTFRIAQRIVALALEGHMPADKVRRDVDADVRKVIESLAMVVQHD